MRLIYGIVLGVGLTIGAAYFHDTKVTGPRAEQQRLVNWGVAAGLVRGVYDAARAQLKEWTG